MWSAKVISWIKNIARFLVLSYLSKFLSIYIKGGIKITGRFVQIWDHITTLLNTATIRLCNRAWSSTLPMDSMKISILQLWLDIMCCFRDKYETANCKKELCTWPLLINKFSEALKPQNPKVTSSKPRGRLGFFSVSSSWQINDIYLFTISKFKIYHLLYSAIKAYLPEIWRISQTLYITKLLVVRMFERKEVVTKITTNCRSCLKCNTFLISISFVALFHSRLEPLKLKKWYTIQCNSESCVSQFLLVKVSINHRPLSKSSAYQIPTTSILNHNTQKFNTQLWHFCWNTDETLTFLKLF